MDLLSPLGRTGAERKTEVISRTDLQEEPASFSGGVIVAKGGLFSGRALFGECSKEPEKPKLLPCREGSRCSQATSASAFLIAGPGGFGVCIRKGYLTKETWVAASSHIVLFPGPNSLMS